jgi:hypothetical protein
MEGQQSKKDNSVFMGYDDADEAYGGKGGAAMNKATALEEMYLIYQAIRNYLADAEPWGERGLEDLVASYHSFCQREPLGGMFLESVLEELLERARGYPGQRN